MRYDQKILSSTKGNKYVYIIPLAEAGYRLIYHNPPQADTWWDYEELSAAKQNFLSFNFEEPKVDNYFRCSKDS